MITEGLVALLLVRHVDPDELPRFRHPPFPAGVAQAAEDRVVRDTQRLPSRSSTTDEQHRTERRHQVFLVFRGATGLK